MSTAHSCLHKTLVTLCCSGTACGTSCYYNMWTATEACGLSNLHQQACCWALCAPICHECKCGDTNEAGRRCGLCVRYCLFSCGVHCVSPCDACYNCIFYNVENCQIGVSGFKEVTKNTLWLGKKIQAFFGLKTSNEPETTFGTFTP